MHLTEDRYQWQGVVNTVMNLHLSDYKLFKTDPATWS
jgi:hypothetical protein